MRTLIGMSIVMAAAFGVIAADEKKVEKIDGTKLVGKWEPKDPKKGEEFVMDFAKDGKLSVTGTLDGKMQTFSGTYKLDGEKLSFDLKVMNETIKETVTLTKLTDDEMEGKDKEGKMESFKRVKPKK